MLATAELGASGHKLWQDKLTLLLESTGEGIYGIDTDGRCTFINRAGAEMLGYAADQLLRRNMHYLIHHIHADGSHYSVADCPIFHAFRQGQGCRIDSDVLWRANGTCFPAEYSSYPIVDNGEIQGAVVTFTDITERKRADAVVRQANEHLELQVAERTQALSSALEQLRELSAHLHSIREEERTRIAREIHDELGSLLVALKFDIGWLGVRLTEAPLLGKCQSMSKLIDTAVDNLGRIITDLRPSILDHQGLWAALEWHAQEFTEASELRCDWSIDTTQSEMEPDGPMATAIFRIFQEILSNVTRHAAARSVRIRITATTSALTITVEDDGCGADPGRLDRPRSYGVIGMRERARHFGGELLIRGMPGDGTWVRLYMPYHHQPLSMEVAP